MVQPAPRGLQLARALLTPHSLLVSHMSVFEERCSLRFNIALHTVLAVRQLQLTAECVWSCNTMVPALEPFFKTKYLFYFY